MVLQEEAIYRLAPSRLDYIKEAVQVKTMPFKNDGTYLISIS